MTKRTRKSRAKAPDVQKLRLTNSMTGDSAVAQQVGGSSNLWVPDRVVQPNAEDAADARRSMAAALSRVDAPYPEFLSTDFGLRWFFDNRIDPNSGDGKARILAEMEARTLANLERLMAHYGIAADGHYCWKVLAIILANRHVEGFDPTRRASKAGAPEKWTVIHEIIFYCWIARRQRLNPNGSVLQFCRALPRNLAEQLPSATDETLRRKFQELASNRRFAEYDAKQIAAHGDDWVERLGDGRLKFDSHLPYIDGLPNVAATKGLVRKSEA